MSTQSLSEMINYYAGFYNQKLAKNDLFVWVDALQNFPLPTVQTAFLKYTKQGVYMPKPAHIVKLCEEFLAYRYSKVLAQAKIKYNDPPHLQREYQDAVARAASRDLDTRKAGWADMQRLRTEMGNQYRRWLKTA